MYLKKIEAKIKALHLEKGKNSNFNNVYDAIRNFYQTRIEWLNNKHSNGSYYEKSICGR